MFGNVFYRDYCYCADDNIISLDNENIKSKLALLYVSSSIGRALKGKYSYGKQFRLGELQKLSVKLLVLPDGTPDFAFMETYTRATQKRVIKNLVEWNAKELAAYQSVI
jgi:hypothetical protein